MLLQQLAVVAAVLIVVAIISFRQSTAAFTEERGSAMRSVAEYLAGGEVVRSAIGDPAATRTLAPFVERAVALSGATDVLVTDVDGVVIAAAEPAEVGTRIDLGESRVREGRGWSGDQLRDGRRYVTAHAPVIADDGTLVGIAVAAQAYPSWWDRVTDSASDLALYLGLGALLGGLGTWAVSRLLKRRTRGLAGDEIATLADHRYALLHSIREGVVAVDNAGTVTVMNDAARRLLDVSGDPVGRPIDTLGLDPELTALVAGDADARDAVVLTGDRVLVVNRRAASSRGMGIGSVTTMRDRTDLVEVEQQLSSNLSISDALRAQTHEFANRLHTISGLVELGEYDELASLLGTLTRERAVLDTNLREAVQDPAVAALLAAKASQASEAGLRLRIDEASRLGTLGPDLAADLTTVLGNLVDNAIDACRAGHGHQVVVRLTEEDDGTIDVVVSDDGPGVPNQIAGTIFSRGFSTKPEVLGGRGIGLPLVRLIATRRGGAATLDEGGPGATFRVRLPGSGT
ncbi:ATPase [Aeromicrobium flavum]|uniref:histidine kinase n=1 Tax=Aeromicrobium flavum TaxID=416568 RepID=A0A512HYL3_9ACTN|nr:ATP-binding protein [Aeromicrobium flavum]GEO90537.1 ATPase [Aeromicrobium flavum]